MFYSLNPVTVQLCGYSIQGDKINTGITSLILSSIGQVQNYRLKLMLRTMFSMAVTHVQKK
jgi:hypothetical protein